MNIIPTQQELTNFPQIRPHGAIGEGGGSHSYSHSDTESAALSSTLYVGTSHEEQIRFKVGDVYGVKITNWIPLHRSHIARKHFRAIGLHVHCCFRQDVISDMFLTPENIIEREVVEVIEL